MLNNYQLNIHITVFVKTEHLLACAGEDDH